MYNSNNVAEKIKTTAREKGISIKQLLVDVGLGRNTMSHFKTSMPKADNLAKIADYLDCSVDYLLGRTTSNNVNSHNNIRGNNNIIGNGNSMGAKLSEQELALLKIFTQLDVVKQAQLLAYAAELGKRN